MEISIIKYLKESLQKFHHPTPLKPQDTPHKWKRPTYGAATQYTDPEDNSAPLPPEGNTAVRNIVVTFIYYALAVDSTMLVALSDLAATQSRDTEKTYYDVVWILNYSASHQTEVVRYKQSKMIIQFNSDVSYWSATKACSIAGGYHYLRNGSE